jgi:hypothetical protein
MIKRKGRTMEDRIRELERLAVRLNAECVEATEIIQRLVFGVSLQMETAEGVPPALEAAYLAADRFLRGEESGANRINRVLDAVRAELGRPDMPMEEMAVAVEKAARNGKTNGTGASACDELGAAAGAEPGNGTGASACDELGTAAEAEPGKGTGASACDEPGTAAGAEPGNDRAEGSGHVAV